MPGRRLALAAAIVGLAVPLGLLWRGNSASSEFSASHQLGDNTVETATVDLVLGRSTAGGTAGLLAPGGQQFLELDVRNDGTLPLLVSAGLRPDDSVLAAALTWEYWRSDCRERPAEDQVHRYPDPSAEQPAGIPVAVGAVEQFCVAAVLPRSATNDLQDATASYRVVFDAVHDIDRS